MIATSQNQADFYREFLMGRGSFDPRDFGVEMTRDEFMDQMVDDFNDHVHSQLSIDELLLRPRAAIYFCDEVRAKRHYYDVPDDIILRSVMNRRKNPNG